MCLWLLSVLWGVAYSGRVMPLTLLSAYSNATCLDGTPGGYYRSPGGDPHRWVIFLEGGGACMCGPVGPNCIEARSCQSRSQSDLGSSKGWSQTTVGAGGIQSDNPAVNPDFYNWTQVFVPYCGGDLHAGTNTQPSPLTWGLHFSGHAIIQALVRDLRAHGLAAAKELIFTGSSAGGMGTFINLDYVAEQVPDARVVGLPQAGYFLLLEPYSGWGIPNELDAMRKHQGPVAPEACVAANGSTTECQDNTPLIAKSLKTPFFIAEAVYDSNQLFVQDGVPNPPSGSNATKYVQNFGTSMHNSLLALVTSRPSVGVWNVGCVMHGLPWTGVHVNGQDLATTFGCWYFGRTNCQTQVGDNPEYPTLNPECGGPTPPPTPRSCLLALALYGCKKDGGDTCWQCVVKHAKGLEAAGCTEPEAKAYCNV